MSGERGATTDWLRAFVPLGTLRGDAWWPAGAGVLLLDLPVIWLVTAAKVLDLFGEERILTWIPRKTGVGMLDLGRSLRQIGIDWLRSPGNELAATLLPVDASFDIRAFSAAQCTRLLDLQPLQPVVSLGCLYGSDIANPGHPAPAVIDGIVSRTEPRANRIYTTAPLLPRNTGAPLLLASPFGGAVTLAGIMTDNVLVADVDPRALPVRLGSAVGIDAALQLIHGPAAATMREVATRRGAPAEGSTAKDSDAS